MPEFSTAEVTETPYLYVERSCSMDPADISAVMGAAFQDVYAHMQANGIAPAGPALAVYYTYDPEKMTFRAGFVVAPDTPRPTEGDVRGDVTPAGSVIRCTHIGPYATLRDDYAAMMGWAEENGHTIGAPAWELYMNDPSEVPEAEWHTEIHVSLA